jgi:hypothetical protein
MPNKVDLTNSMTIGGAVLAFIGVIWLFMINALDDFLWDAGYATLYSLGALGYAILFDLIPFILMFLGIIIAFYGIYKSRE